MEKLLESGTEIIVKNAEGDPDTTATIIHQNCIDYEPKVSVIIPVYNTEEYLRECLDSVVNQTLKEIEIICVDDGSTDSSLEILKEYAQKDNRFTIITQENLHAGVARNAGLAVAKGEYVSFLDSDDFFKENMLKTLFENSINNNCEIGICSGEKLLYPDKIIQEMPWLQKKDTEQIIMPNEEEDLFNLTSPNCWNKIFKKSFIDKYNVRFQNLLNCNDVFFVGLTLGLSNKIYLTPEKFVIYKYGTNAQITQKIHKSPLSILKALELLEKKLKQYNKNKKIIFSLKKESINHFIYALKNCKSDNIGKIIEKFQNFYCKSDRKIMLEKMKISMTIPIVFAINQNFAKYFSVTLESVIKNIKNNYFYKIYVFYDELNKNTIKLFSKYNSKSVNIEFININKYIEKLNLYSRAHYSKEMYYRILIPEILSKYTKVIYLDSDLIVKSDISDLYKIELGKNLIGGVSNFCNYGMCKYVEKLGLEPPKYINSGVLLFNIKECIRFEFKTKALSLLDDYTNLACPDQDIINMVCKNKIKILDDTWNFMWQHLFYEEMGWTPLHESYQKRYLKQKENFNIIHYTSFKKPWNSEKNKYSDIWWEYASNSPYYKNSFIENIFSIKVDPIKNQHKIITILGLKLKIRKKDYGVSSFIENIFSIKNEHIRKQHKIITIFGLKLKIKRKEYGDYSFIERIFSVTNQESKNNKWYKVVRILGIKLSFKNKDLTNVRRLERLEQRINQVCNSQEHQFKQMSNKLSSTTQNIDKQIKETNSNLENKIKSLEMVLLDQQSTQAKILDEKFNKIYNQIRIKKENKALNFKSMQEVTDLIRNNVKILPEDIDLVVGIPRSGIIPAYLIALFLNKNACSLNEFVNNMLPQKGERPINEVANDNRKKHVLIVDDSIYNGTALSKAKEQLKNIDTSIYDISYCAIFAREESKDKVDYYFEIVNPPRMFQWNYLNHANAAVSCYDIDGVLCVDPTPEQNDDGEKYIDFILNAKPLFIPSYEINSLVTSRLEKYRPQTEEWLKKHNIKYKNLYMLDLETAEERRKLGCHAEFKAKIYQEKDDCNFFIESEREQAKKIAEITGKQVICVTADEYFGG